MTKTVVSLDDKYRQREGHVFMSAIQALVRLPLEQARRDKAAGLVTAGFISGYRGSPLGTYDAALWNAQSLLDEEGITFLPALNEELAASSVRGTQELNWLGKSQKQGIFALWYGKGVGTDRAMEALKLGNLEGAAAHGGVLVLTGDDHGGKSSASAHQSEHALIAALIPILYPSTTDEIISFGLAGWAMSRASGAYVALKCVTDTLDHSSSFALPETERAFVPPGDLESRLSLQPNRPPLVQEEIAVTLRLPAAQAFAHENGLDRVMIDSPHRNLGIVTAGKAYLDVRQAMDDLGLDAEACAALGIRVYKPGLIWPLEPTGALGFARGHKEVLVIEEKRPVIEDQLAALLYPLDPPERPALSGKRSADGHALCSAVGETTPASVRRIVLARLQALGLASAAVRAKAAQFHALEVQAAAVAGSGLARPPYYCSGCPHNTGTRLPDGSIAISAVGCHGLAAYMPERRTLMPMPMGGDGMPWVAAGPHVDTPHIFQNMGDGTYAHSGILSIRAAVAAKAVMTFKILYNDAVAMTGGQPVEGMPTPLDIVRQLLAERVDPVVIVSDQPEDFTGGNTPPGGVSVYHRDELDLVQRRLQNVKGVSGLVYVQTCAAEKRRRRKRGSFPDPDRRVFINTAVCEGCGDCSVQSNCLSIQPIDTEFGRKRVIDQSSCNKDFSCVKGFCPSFVTVEGARLINHKPGLSGDFDAAIAALPEPCVHATETPYRVLTTGIGGTGVLTVGAVLGMAAHLDGKACTVMDQTGMAQKGGAVTSHLQVTDRPRPLFAARLDTGKTDLILACDMVVASGASVLATVRKDETRAVLNVDVTPTGAFQTNRDDKIEPDKLEATIKAALGSADVFGVPATRLATTLFGDSIAANFLMVGYAMQKGLLPVTRHAVEEAIRLNGTNVAENLRTLALGRLIAHQPERFARELASEPPTDNSLTGVKDRYSRLLTDYQDAAYARRYVHFLDNLAARIPQENMANADFIMSAIAAALGRLMVYKDEYEVARLYTSPAFGEALGNQFAEHGRLIFHLAPPLFSRIDPASGRPRKIALGGWMMTLFKGLAALRRLRGTAFDPFGYTSERRQERALIAEYQELATFVAERLTETNTASAFTLLSAVHEVRGFGPVKEAAIAAYHKRLPLLMEAFEQEVERRLG
jgi:indolepyruvate ferredoxin oxidoreductase